METNLKKCLLFHTKRLIVFKITDKNKIMEHPEIYHQLDEIYKKEMEYLLVEKQIQLENEWRQWEKEQEKLKSPAKIILQINTENEINNTSREISRDY